MQLQFGKHFFLEFTQHEILLKKSIGIAKNKVQIP
jgi:hypothetical protein